jgi:peptide/nickel transport system permease protein
MKKRKNWELFIGLILVGVVIVLVLLGIFWTPYQVETMNVSEKLQGVSWHHIFGTDQFGRDVFSRVMKGMGVSFLIATGTVAIGLFFGFINGATSGYFGGIYDEMVMRITDTFFAFPAILIALVIVSLFGSGKYYILLALGIAFIPSFTRVIRAEYIKQRGKEYVDAAKIMGAKNLRIIFVHILPNCKTMILTNVLIGFNNAILAEAGMSYLSIGVQPPDASLGRMLSESQAYLFSAPWCAIFPGIMIVVMVLGFTLLAEGLKGKTNGRDCNVRD